MLQLDDLRLDLDGFRLNAAWSVMPGEKLALIGPSGSGKSTLLLAIAGFITPQSGRVVYGGKDLTTLLPSERPVTMLFQDQNLFPHLTLAQNLGLGVSANLRLTQDQHEQVAQALVEVGLAGLGAHRPASLSGGQQSRAALARALLRRRPILLLDEPFSALGPAMKSEMLELVDKVASAAQSTVLMVTHDPRDAVDFADKTVVFADGVALPPVPTRALFAQPTDALRAYLGDRAT